MILPYCKKTGLLSAWSFMLPWQIPFYFPNGGMQSVQYLPSLSLDGAAVPKEGEGFLVGAMEKVVGLSAVVQKGNREVNKL